MSVLGTNTSPHTGRLLLLLYLVTVLAVVAWLVDLWTSNDSSSSTTTITATTTPNLNHPLEAPSGALTRKQQQGEDDLPQDPEGRKATAFSLLFWPEGSDGLPLVPYVVVNLKQLPLAFTWEAAPGYRQAARRGMTYWMLHTCVKFVEVRHSTGPHLRLIRGPVCRSAVGRVSKTGQDVAIGPGCRKLGRMVRLLARALGWYDEHNRPDRDLHVHVNEENVAPLLRYRLGKVPSQLVTDFGVPYDLTSLMHADAQFLSANGRTTLATINPLLQGLIGQNRRLTHRDKLLANLMYRCTAKWIQACDLAVERCSNGGYTHRDCSCVCPAGTVGDRCENVIGEYYDSLLPDCTEVVQTQTNISSPGHPGNYDRDSWCVKWIKAPPCYKPVITFHAFHLYGRNSYRDDQPLCYLDSLEIRSESLYSGEVYCDKEISSGQSFTSSSGNIVLYFKTQTDYFPGWVASVTFIPIPGCFSNETTTVPSTTSSSVTTMAAVSTTVTLVTATATTTNSTSSILSTSTTTSNFTAHTITTPTTTIITTTTTPTTTTIPTTATITSTETSTKPPTTSIPLTETAITTTTIPTSSSTTTSPITTTTTTPTTTFTTTTTPITTITSTAITITTPDTLTTTDTGTISSNPNCGLQDKRRRYHWTSPNFPCQNYPNNFTCIIRGGSRRPFWAIFQFSVFQLPLGCGDQVTLSLPFSREVVFCGIRSRPYLAPTFNFEASFTTDTNKTDIGFNLTVTPKRSPCHKRVLLTENDTLGNVSIWKSGKVRQLVLCEWWIEAPQGSRLRVERVMTTIARTKNCKIDYLVINGKGQKMYPASSSIIYCGRMNAVAPLVTSGNLLFVVYRGRVPWSKGFILQYKILT